MRNRRSILAICLVLAILCVGVGFAAVTDVLDVIGTVEVSEANAQNAFDANLYFSDAVANRAADGDSASVSTSNNDKVTFTAACLMSKDEETTFTFTIQNDNDVAAKVTPVLDAAAGNTNAEYFAVSSDWNGAAQTIDAHSSKTYTVTVKLLKAATGLVTGNIDIELRAESVDVTP